MQQVRRDSGTIVSQTAHGEPKWNLHPPDKEVRWERVGTEKTCVVLPQGTPVIKVPGAGLPRGSTQRSKALGTFHVPTFLVTDSGGPGGKLTSAPLRLVRNAHARGEAHQASLDGTMSSEYADEVEDKGCGDSSKVHRGDLKSNGVGRIGLF